MEDSSEGQHAVDLTGFSGQTFLYKLDDEPTLRSASFARGLADPFVERTGKRDVLPHVRCHEMIIHTEVTVIHTVVPSEAIDELARNGLSTSWLPAADQPNHRRGFVGVAAKEHQLLLFAPNG